MRVAVTIQHPAHVHFFKYAIDDLSCRGHEVRVYAREKAIAVDLLERYDIDHEVLAGSADSLASLAAVQATYEARLFRHLRRFDPDVVTAIGGVAAAHVSGLVGARSVVFYDTEHATLVTRLAYPFADAVCTPLAYRDDLGPKQYQYPGCHELAYLHPDRFFADPGVFDDLSLDPDERFAVVRLSDWSASHDVGQGGFADPGAAVERLEAAGARVVVTAEGDLPEGLAGHRARVAPHRIHDLLAHADLFVGEGATMAAESAVLGTPAVYVNSLSMGYTDWLEEQGLLFGHHGPDRHRTALDRAESVLDSDTDWDARRERLLARSTDTTRVVVDHLERVGGGT